MGDGTPIGDKSKWLIALATFVLGGILGCFLCRPGHQQGPPVFRRARFFNASGKPATTVQVIPKQNGAPQPMGPVNLPVPPPPVPSPSSNSGDADKDGFSVNSMMTTDVVEVTCHVVLSSAPQPTDVTVALTAAQIQTGSRIDEIVFTLLPNNTIQAHVYHTTDSDLAMSRAP